MRRSEWVAAWLDRAESCGVRQDVIGDLHEEMGRGKSCTWLCRQLLAIAAHATRARVGEGLRTRFGICCVVSLSGLIAWSVVPAGELLTAWLVIYYASGVLSLLGHMTFASEEVTSEAIDE
jgi:hypothetical protein